MLPLESLLVVNHQKISRMPSVSSILAAYAVKCKVGENSALFIFSIDFCDAFYLLNPSGDLKVSQDNFEKHFTNKKLEVLYLFKLVLSC
jgi:hypothetical protein